MWKIIYTKRVITDAKKIAKIGLKDKTQHLLEIIGNNPFHMPPPYEKLVNLKNTYSRRIDIRYRLVYEVIKEEKLIIVRLMYKHYGD